MSFLLEFSKNINELAKDYEIGELQKFRKARGGKARLPSTKLFDERTVFEEWGWHYGGRQELQFNIGLEGGDVRYGVAFSLGLSQALPSIDILIPKIALFNEYIAEYGTEFSDMCMWHFDNGERSEDHAPSPIRKEDIREGMFIFFGKKERKELVSYEDVLATLNRLYPLYKFIEESSLPYPSEITDNTGFFFKPGCTKKRSFTTSNILDKELNVTLRHNDIQLHLYNKLAEKYGKDNVGTEIRSNGKSIDLVVKQNNEYWFYEIKIASSAKACIRQALGQIFEYSYWPGNQTAQRLVVVGEATLNSKERDYIEHLRKSFNIPLEYQSANGDPN